MRPLPTNTYRCPNQIVLERLCDLWEEFGRPLEKVMERFCIADVCSYRHDRGGVFVCGCECHRRTY